MSFPVKRSVWRPGKWKLQKNFWISFPWFANKGYSNDIQKEENGEMNYILSVNENFTNDHEVGCIVDASKIGNGARFANHSCKPNAKLVPIHIENDYPRIRDTNQYIAEQYIAQ